ncbi:MAG: histidine phosphatase family protein [Propionibacteriaceae bacterium]|nr:histidine phosphatase family protein [Propionibacteriaceae bacterium]
MSEKTLLILRHAKSSWSSGASDFERPLAARGLGDASVAGAILATTRIDLVLCSAALRTRQTWEQAVAAGAQATDVEYSKTLYLAWSTQLLAHIQQVSEANQTVLLIGHQPSLGDLIASLAAPGHLRAQIEAKFPTCALATLNFSGKWKDLSSQGATLTSYQIPRGVDRAG